MDAKFPRMHHNGPAADAVNSSPTGDVLQGAAHRCLGKLLTFSLRARAVEGNDVHKQRSSLGIVARIHNALQAKPARASNTSGRSISAMGCALQTDCALCSDHQVTIDTDSPLLRMDRDDVHDISRQQNIESAYCEGSPAIIIDGVPVRARP